MPRRSAGTLQTPPGAAQPIPVPDPSSRDRLLKAAIEVFERKGYAAASVREIVERARLTKPVLYYYFGSKQGLILAILDTAVRELSAVIDDAEAAAGPVRDRVLRICTAVYRLIGSRRSELRVSHAVYFTAAELVPSFDFQAFDRLLTGAIERAIRAGIDARQLRPVSPADAVAAILGVLVLCFDQEILHRDDRLDESGLVRVLDLVLDGLCQVS